MPLTKPTDTTEPQSTNLSEDSLFETTAAPRRRNILRVLGDVELDETIEAGEIADEVSEMEEKARQTCYISITQNHLPKLANLGLIEYDDVEKTVQPTKDVYTITWLIERGHALSNEGDTGEVLEHKPLVH